MKTLFRIVQYLFALGSMSAAVAAPALVPAHDLNRQLATANEQAVVLPQRLSLIAKGFHGDMV